MNLAIDIGNTKTKYGLFVNSELKGTGQLNENIIPEIDELLSDNDIKCAIVSTVGNGAELLYNKLSERVYCIELSNQTSLPIRNKYSTKETLGSDRMANAVGIATLYPGENCLAIDCGTCITYDFVNDEACYLGGGISPGIEMRLNSLHKETAKLPKVSSSAYNGKLIGNSTEESIETGVLMGTLFEVEKFIETYREQYPNLKVVLTGGDHSFFANNIKSSIFADPYLLLKGLNAILEYNI